MREASGGGSDEEGNVGGIGDGAVGDVEGAGILVVVEVGENLGLEMRGV